jgi:dolichol-phosphate mannosyltransferase
VAGFVEALRLGADLIVEMDADWSHHPRFIPALVGAAQAAGGADAATGSWMTGAGADVVVGSRMVAGGGEVGRTALRKWITLGASLYIRTVLGLPVRDCTSGFRVFRRGTVEAIDMARLDSNGPAIVQEILMACKAQGCRFAEVPILFEPRRTGQSTFSTRIMLAGFWAVLRFRFRDWRAVLKR